MFDVRHLIYLLIHCIHPLVASFSRSGFAHLYADK
jgi:hypothetical protein